MKNGTGEKEPVLMHRCLTLLLIGSWAVAQPPTGSVYVPPAMEERPSIADGRLTLINGRRLTPSGKYVRTQSYSWGLAISHDESHCVLMAEDALQVIDLRDLSIRFRFPEFGAREAPLLKPGTYMGCVFDPSGQHLYFGLANRGSVVAFHLAKREPLWEINLNGNGFAESFIGDLAITRDGGRLFALDQHNNRLVAVDLQQRAVLWTTRVGRSPFGVRLAPDERFAWVANVGMFEYPLLPGVTPANRETAGLSFPPFGIPSKEAEQGVVIDGKKIPGLGSPNHPDAMSVFKINLANGKVEAKIKTGYLVGTKRGDITTVGGASPSTVAIGQRFVYVANSTNDTISVIDAWANQIAEQIELNVPGLEKLRGVLPFGVALDPDERRLYVACAGLNAVAVVDVVARRHLGYIPAGWFCSFVKVARDGRRLWAASVKGVGSGRNAGQGFVRPARGTHAGDIMEGLLQAIDVPDGPTLARYTQQVIANTYAVKSIAADPANPLPPAPGIRKSPIRHIVFIVKENRTFDQVFGARLGVAGDPALAKLGLKVRLRNPRGQQLNDADVTPNHHALADRYAIGDNFHCDSDQSNTGHRWVVGVYPNEWVEVNAKSRIDENVFSAAPGRRYVNGSSATINPEDYNEAGALWEHLHRHQIRFFNFGFGTEMPGSIEEAFHKYTGMQMAVAFPLPKPLFDHTSRRFATFNMSIPDQFRVDMFEQDFAEKWASGKEPFPALITMVLPNDHMAKPHPGSGYPFAESYVADNDLALGRVVHKLSRSPYWKHMLIIVVEDDPVGGVDSMEAHRSLFMLIGPYVKRGYVTHRLLNFGSVMKLIFTLLDLPSLNHFDATASLPDDCFTAMPDFSPFQPRPSDLRLFDPQQALKPFDRGFDWKRLLDSPDMDNSADMRALHREKE